MKSIALILTIFFIVTFSVAQRLFFMTVVQQKPAAGWSASVRGLTWATDFSEGADAQVLYNTIEGETVGTGTGQRGSTTGSDSDDPTWGTSGAEFDGGDRFRRVPYSGVADHIDTTAIFSIHSRVYHTASGGESIWSSINNGATKGSYFANTLGGTWLYFVNVNNVGGTYRQSWSGDTGWHTFSVTGNGTTLTFYVDGSSIGTGTAATVTAQDDPDQCEIGHAYNLNQFSSSGTKQRALLICDVEHDSTEVSDIHTLLAALPNAA